MATIRAYLLIFGSQPPPAPFSRKAWVRDGCIMLGGDVVVLGHLLPVKWRPLIRESDLVPGKVEVRKVFGHLTGIVKTNGHIYVFGGKCPHAGRSLQDSEVTGHGILVCPGHGLQFSLTPQPCSVNAMPLPQLSFRVCDGMVEINRDCLWQKRA
jgi:nitrite reductase/ring-hydroxylating ferredoxin subunit